MSVLPSTPSTSLIIKLETKPGAPLISFHDMNIDAEEQAAQRAQSEPAAAASSSSSTSSVLPSSSSFGAGAGAGRAPRGGLVESSSSSTIRQRSRKADRNAGRDARTYSEVVVETVEPDSFAEQMRKAADAERKDVKTLKFFSGHKNVEKTEGILHFYKNKESVVNESRLLCMLGVPSHLSCSDVLSFFSPAFPSIDLIKVVKDQTPSKYMLLLLFKSSEDAAMFYADFNDQLFSSLESDRCLLLFVERIEQLDCEILEEDLVELPTCAVCLERMDEGVIRIFCRHSFHAICIQKCTDTICPVCRSTQTPELEALQRCSECDNTKDLWICMICGNVACGRYAEAHAFRHFEQTSHTFAKEIRGNRVWDYAGDNYVHRLIQADQDGKLVAFERGGEQAVEGAEKTEALTLEYTCLLTNQLDDQRRYWEQKLADCERSRTNLEKLAIAQMDDLEAQLNRAVTECERLREELAASQAAKVTTEKRQAQMTSKLNKVTAELSEERNMNKIVRSDHEKWKSKVETLVREKLEQKIEYDKRISDMEEQLRDLMMHFEAKQKIDTQLEATGVSRDELEEGVVTVGPSTPQSDKKTRKKRGSKS